MKKKTFIDRFKTAIGGRLHRFVMPGVFARMSTIQAENICNDYMDGNTTQTLYVFKDKKTAKTFCESRLAPAKTKA